MNSGTFYLLCFSLSILFHYPFISQGQHFTKLEDGSPLVTEIIPSVGASWNDINNDGWIDLFISGFSSNSTNYNRLYMNNGDGTYTAQENSAFVQTGGLGTAIVLLADFTQDGNKDVFMGNYENASNQPTMSKWLVNNGPPDYSLTENNPIGNPATRVPSGSWVDFDLDHDLDLYFTSALGTTDRYYENDGNGSFSMIDSFPFLETRNSFLTFDSWIDYDNDGDLDLYIATFSTSIPPENKLFKNMFSETLETGYFLETEVSGLTDWASSNIGINWVDIDNDRLPDLYANVYESSNRLFHNNGDGTFTELFDQPIVQVSGSNIGTNAWADFDNDGDLDLYLTKSATSTSNGHLFVNDGSGNFTELNSSEAGPLVGTIAGNIQATDWGDYDNDGDMDLFLVGTESPTVGKPNYLFRNDLGSDANWLKVTWNETISDGETYGGKVSVKANINGQPVWQVRYIHGGLSSFGFQGDIRPNFGLGNATIVDTLIVDFPTYSIFCTNFPVNQIIELGTGECPDMVLSADKDGLTFGSMPMLEIHPNPVTQSLSLHFNKSNSGQIKLNVTNVYGQKIAEMEKTFNTQNSNILDLDVRQLQTGIYFINLEYKGRIETYKFVKQ